MKTCPKCGLEKPLTDFNIKSLASGLRHAHCRVCTRLFVKNHYDTNREYYLIKSRKRNAKLRSDILKYVYGFLSEHPCVDCGEPDITVLEFDHREEFLKLKAVSTMIRARARIEDIQREIGKCEVRCANCHRRKTAKDFRWFKSALVA